MSFVTTDSEPHGALQRVRHSLISVWTRPEPGDNPYSAPLCLALLLIVGLIVKLAH
jgi:hypothetical protein